MKPSCVPPMLAAVVLLGCDGAGEATPDAEALDAPAGCVASGVTEADAKRTSSENSVTVDATFLNAVWTCAKTELEFKIVLDTHSVDLLEIDVAGSVRVSLSSGTTAATGFVWRPSSETSHHREGTLTVAEPDLAGADWLRLTLVEIAGQDRVLEWDSTFLEHDLH